MRAWLAVHDPDASSAPVLAAAAALGDADTPYFWTFSVGGGGPISADGLERNYHIEGLDLPGRDAMLGILGELGIEGVLFGPYGQTYVSYGLLSHAPSGTRVVEEINGLHERLGDDVWIGILGYGCPSGGGGGGPGTLGTLEIPTLGGFGLALLATVLGAAALWALGAGGKQASR